MLVYGDRREEVDPRACAQGLEARWAEVSALPPGLDRHARLAAALIDVGKLAQGVADAAFERDGCDDGAERGVGVAVRVLAGALGASWREGLAQGGPTPAPRLDGPMPERVTLREPEGYAFYAVYPELFLEAGLRAFDRAASPAVVGLRSIGASLGAAAACGATAKAPISLRPTGDPFDRRLSLSGRLADRLARQAQDGVLVVDEGPGASGSSFGTVGDLLEGMGVPAERVTYMPSHLGDLGPQASDRHRARWRTARKAHASFEEVILPRLAGWAEPLVGRAVAPLEDLSGGRWREGALRHAPAWPEGERRKYRLTTAEGAFLLKFAGLGDIGEAKLARARALHAAGWGVEPLGLVHGFLVERFLSLPLIPASAATQAVFASEGRGGSGEEQVWVPACAGTSGGEGISLNELGAYLAFRTGLPAPQPGASPDLLRTMMRRNLSLAGLLDAAALAERLPAPSRIVPAAIDGRLHAWEWRRAPSGRLVKLDALDHCQAHDLVGAQDVAWDVAGAAVEFDLSTNAAERLSAEVSRAARRELDPRSLDFHTLAYLAFQIGLWTFAAQGCEGERAAAEAARYTALAAAWRPHR